MNKSTRSGANKIPKDEQNEASFSSPSAPRNKQINLPLSQKPTKN